LCGDSFRIDVTEMWQDTVDMTDVWAVGTGWHCCALRYSAVTAGPVNCNWQDCHVIDNGWPECSTCVYIHTHTYICFSRSVGVGIELPRKLLFTNKLNCSAAIRLILLRHS